MNIYKNQTNIKENENCIVGEKYGTITVSIYKETKSGSPIFHVQSDNEKVLPVSYVIEDLLSIY